MKENPDFSFGAMASSFDDHISHSIRGYKDLRSDCVSFSQYFIQPNTKVLDIGCSSGEFLRSVRDHNQKRYASTEYIGLDIEDNVQEQWLSRKDNNISYRKQNIIDYPGYENLSVVFSLFTLQFISERERLPLVKRIYDGLNEGGALILSEKVHAKNAKIQDMLTFVYYDFKRNSFSSDEILDKEKSIRDQMHLWSEYKIFEMLRAAGFASNNLQLFWRNHLFIGILAWKQPRYR